MQVQFVKQREHCRGPRAAHLNLQTSTAILEFADCKSVPIFFCRSTRRCLYGFATTCGVGLLVSSCALTFWICAACSFTVATRRATVFSNSEILFCCFWNSLRFAWGWARWGPRVLTFCPLALTSIVPK